jgi:6-pyruvoyl-tetrahydropterin synthase
MFVVEIREQFTARHAVQVPGGRWEKSHVHSWRLRIFLTRRRLNRYAMVVDFHLARRVVRAVLDRLEGRDLNTVKAIGKSPTTELVARHIFDQVSAFLGKTGVKVKSVALCETDDCWAWYAEHPIP